MNNIRHRDLRIVCQDKRSSFEEIFQKDKSVSVYMRNLHYLATEIFKVKNGPSIIMNEGFSFSN